MDFRGGVTGDAELRRVLARLPKLLEEQVLADGNRAAARVVLKEARARAPRDLGILAQSLTVARPTGIAKRAYAGRTAGVVFLGARRRKVADPRRKRGFDIPSRRLHLAEFGDVHRAAQPFVRPAFASQGQAALAKGRVVMWAKLQRLAAELAGPYADMRKRTRRALVQSVKRKRR